jgi:MFS transporter, DHA1 family, inner membrane transport protein
VNGLVARVVGFAAVVPLALLVAPLLTGQLIAERGLSPAQTGIYFLFELGGISLASLPALWWSRRWPGGRIATVAALVFIAGNALSIVVAGFAALLAVRLVTAVAGGALMILSMNAAAASDNRDRLFALWIGGQLVLAAIALTLLPRLFAAWGLGAYYAGMALLMALLLPLAPGFAMAAPARARAGGGNGLLFPAVAMLAVMAFYVGLGGCWAFVSVIATRAGLAMQPVADRLALASLLGIAGASAAAALGGRAARRLVLPAGYGLLIVAVALLGLRLDIARFAFAVCLFKFGWTFALPFVLGAIAARDRGGAIMAAVNLVIGTGTSLGPVLTGIVLERIGVVPMLACCAAAMIVSLALVALIESGRLSGESA